eukprot:scaffold2126_cov417-Prasinococcus_capsulatus_cf.AAC.3
MLLAQHVGGCRLILNGQGSSPKPTTRIELQTQAEVDPDARSSKSVCLSTDSVSLASGWSQDAVQVLGRHHTPTRQS